MRSTNPGSPATRTVSHGFEVKPSELQGEVGQGAGKEEELLITWDGLPSETVATVYLPRTDIEEVLSLAAARQGPPVIEKVDSETVRLQVGDVSFLPLPGHRTTNIAALLTLELPDGVREGEVFTVTVRQYGRQGVVIGTFQLTIRVDHDDAIVPAEKRAYAVLRHIASRLDQDDRWYPVFDRYLGQLADRLRGFGIEPDAIAPSPDGIDEVAPEFVGALVHRAGPENTNGNSTSIDDPATNGMSEAIVLVTPNWNPGGVDGIYNDHSVGVWYEIDSGSWAIFNQDLAPIPMGAAFNVRAVPRSDDAFVHPASPENTKGNSTSIDHPATNGMSEAIVLVTPNWNPGGVDGIYNDHPIGVWYEIESGRWAIYNQDLAPIPIGAAFNVRALPRSDDAFVHRASPENTAGNSTSIDHPATNGMSEAIVVVTPNWNPGGGEGIYNDHPIGVWYQIDAGLWAIFNQDLAAIPMGAAFNVWVLPGAGPKGGFMNTR